MSTVTGQDEYRLSQQPALLGDDGVSCNSTKDDNGFLNSGSGETTNLLLERLGAWRHVCDYLVSYISATAKAQRTQSKEYETILKSVSYPLKDRQHFKSSTNGVAGLFENIHKNTQEMVEMYIDAERNLKDRVLPMLERLHREIKMKMKELKADEYKGGKTAEKARRATQKHIMLLAQSTVSYDAATENKIEQYHDPYLLRRGIDYQLKKQVMKENSDRQDSLEIQESFLWFEMHVLQTVQCALARFFQHMDGQLDLQRTMYGDILGTAQLILPDLEWMSFVERSNATLLDPRSPLKSLETTTFPNMDHPATEPIIEGDLERLSHGIAKDYNTGYYVVTPAGYMHGFSHNVDSYHRPVPNLSLYLPNCTTSAVNGVSFGIQGVDVSSRMIRHPFRVPTEFSFRAHSVGDAEKWRSVLEETIGRATSS